MEKPQTDRPEERADGLTRNCVDSIRHALDHFSANYSDEYGFHNQKWAILSVAHAAEAFCNLLLFTIDHNHPNGRKYPDLERAINALKGSQSPALTKSELHAIKDIFPGIEKQRDELMHRIPPQQLDPEHAALVLLALLYLVRRQARGRPARRPPARTPELAPELSRAGTPCVLCQPGRLGSGDVALPRQR